MIKQWSLGSAIRRIRSLVNTDILCLIMTRKRAHSEGWKERGEKIVVEGFRIQIRLKDMLTLELDDWLNDNIINFNLKVG